MIRLAAKIEGDEVASIKSRLWVYDDPEFCAPYLVNDMISVEGEAVRVTFGSSGKPSGYSCSLNSTKPFICKFEHHMHAFLCTVSFSAIRTQRWREL